MNGLVYFWIFLRASLLSTGGTGNLPALHADLLARHAATEHHFAAALLVGQISPGPNGLWAVSLGYLTRGPAGALLALVAISLPPLLVLAAARLYSRVRSHPAAEGLMHGLASGVAGVSLAVLPQILASAGISMRTLFISAGAGLLSLDRRIPVAAIIAAGALAGLMWR